VSPLKFILLHVFECSRVVFWDGILKQLKTMLDQFLSEGFLISHSSCDFASAIVIVKKSDGICMADDYHVEYAGKISRLISPHCFKDWVVQVFMQKLISVPGDITNCVSLRIVQRLQLWGCTTFLHAYLVYLLHLGNIKLGWRTRFCKIII